MRITKIEAVRGLENRGQEFTDRQAAGCGPSRSTKCKKKDGECTLREYLATVLRHCKNASKVETRVRLSHLHVFAPKNCINSSTSLFAIEGIDQRNLEPLQVRW